MKTHWEKIYATRPPHQVSWYRPHLETSLALIERAARDCSASVIDVGEGESTLVDDLLANDQVVPAKGTTREADLCWFSRKWSEGVFR